MPTTVVRYATDRKERGKKPRRLEIDDGKPPAWTKRIAKAPIRLGRLRDVMVHAAQENRVTAPGRQVRGSLAGLNDRNVVEARGDGFGSNIRDVFLPNLSSDDLPLCDGARGSRRDDPPPVTHVGR